MENHLNQRRFSVWTGLLLSFFSADFYRDVGRNWRGIGLRLLILVLVISCVLTGVRMHIGLHGFARDEFPKLVESFPPISIKDGVVSTPVEQPYTIVDHTTGKAWAVIDTTGQINSLDQTPAVVLLTSNKLHFRNNDNGEQRITDLSKIKSFDIDRAKVTGWMNAFSVWAAPVFVVLGFVFSLIYRLIQGLIYAAIGLIWNSAFNARLSYAALMRLAFVAVTPVILLDTLISLVGITIPLWWLICLIIAMVYLSMAVKANEQPPMPAMVYAPPTLQPYPQGPFPPAPP